MFDLFPTIAEICAVTLPDKVDGRSLIPVLKGESRKIHDFLFAAYRDVQRMVRTDRWKLIRYPQCDRTQLFDLAQDPQEMTDLSAEAALADQRRSLEALLIESQVRWNDPLCESPGTE